MSGAGLAQEGFCRCQVRGEPFQQGLSGEELLYDLAFRQNIIIIQDAYCCYDWPQDWTRTRSCVDVKVSESGPGSISLIEGIALEEDVHVGWTLQGSQGLPMVGVIGYAGENRIGGVLEQT